MRIRYTAGVCGVLLAMVIPRTGAQELRRVSMSGVLHDYGPSTISGGPYEMRGEWSLGIDRTGAGSFTVDMTMETSDYGITDSTQVDPTNPGTRMPHTHHITVTGATVTYDVSVCPANNPPTTGSGVVLTGTATTTGNGNPAPFEAKGSSTVQVCITGGSEVEFSNMTLVYTGPATTHFGPQPIHGVVTVVATK